MDIIGTLFLPICGKKFVLPEWEDNLRNLNLPKDQMKVVLCDATGGNETGKECADIVRSLGFAKCHIEVFTQTPTPNIRRHWDNFLTMGLRVGETFINGIHHSEGELFLFLEDDVMVHPDTFIVMIDRFLANESIGVMSACTFKKKENNTTDVIAGKDNNHVIIGNGGPAMMLVDWVATGCVVTHGNIARYYDWDTAVNDTKASPDISYCKYLREYHNLSVCLCTDISTKHIYKRNNVKTITGEIKCPSRKEITYDITSYKTPTIAKRTKDAPIFIVSYTGRGGSTFLQRILTSSDDIIINGEPQGVLGAIFDFANRMFDINNKGTMTTGWDQYQRHGYKGWIACKPPKKLKLVAFIRHQIESFYNSGKSKIWGIKVIDWNSALVTRMHKLYPDATFIYLHRNLLDVYKSYLNRKEWWSDGVFNSWTKNHKELSEMCDAVPINMHRINIDFDEAKKDLVGMCNMLEDELMIDNGSLDRTILNHHVSSYDDANKFYGKDK